MEKKRLGFAITGSEEAKKQGVKGGKKGGRAKVPKGFAVKGDPSAMAKRSWELRRQRKAAEAAAKQSEQ